MRTNFLRAIFIVIGVLTVFFSFAVAFILLCEKLKIEFAENDSLTDDFSFEDDEFFEPIIVCAENDDESGEPQNI